MFIICPKCAAKYQIPEGINLQEGQKLKCSACDFVFSKGEESPLVLDQPIVQEPTETVTDAFSSPLYKHPDSEIPTTTTQSTPLPEAFQPVANPEKSRIYLWFIPIYIILIIALCMMGWHFRDSLKPSIQEIVPQVNIEKNIAKQETITETNRPEESIKPTIPQKKEKTKPAIKPTQSVTVEKEEIFVPIDTTVTPKTLPITEQIIQETIPQTEPQNQVNPNQPLIITDLILPPQEEEELVPLFEAITDPIPIAGKEELAVTQISFKIAPNEQGIEQLLVEGSIQNGSSALRSVPPLTVVLFNKDNIVLTRKKIHVDTEHLAPEQILPFYTGITPVPSGVDHVEVQF